MSGLVAEVMGFSDQSALTACTQACSSALGVFQALLVYLRGWLVGLWRLLVRSFLKGKWLSGTLIKGTGWLELC